MATFYNQATLSYKGISVSSNIATGELVSALSASKTAVTDTYSTGSELVYVVSLVNSSASDVTALTLTDDLGAYEFGAETLVPLTYVDGSIKYFIDGVLQPAPTVTASDPLTVTGISVPAGGTSTLIYAAAVNSYAPPEAGGSITNTASITGTGVTELTASETVTAAAESLLDIAKSVSPTTVSENGEVTYTFVITNSGAAEAGAADSVSVTDTFTPILSNIAVSFNGAQMEKSVDYTYNEVSGVFATVPGSIIVPAATFTQDAVSGAWSCEPGSVALTVTGTI
ncbi:MAG: hypothetical protein IKZ82_01190 [Clostridia bacterium]|nr:hypothetical protein [Clostridia bacterium]